MLDFKAISNIFVFKATAATWDGALPNKRGKNYIKATGICTYKLDFLVRIENLMLQLTASISQRLLKDWENPDITIEITIDLFVHINDYTKTGTNA